jgi:hypothetical protein
MSGYFARRAAVNTTRWAAWRIKNRKQLHQAREQRAYEQMTEQQQLESIHRYITQDRRQK